MGPTSGRPAKSAPTREAQKAKFRPSPILADNRRISEEEEETLVVSAEEELARAGPTLRRLLRVALALSVFARSRDPRPSSGSAVSNFGFRQPSFSLLKVEQLLPWGRRNPRNLHRS
ncbi:hypothetical protein NL676_004357 [Syzygium grande]|nr:hypothetical protein NL676_004357 [Syzygium grande]